MCIAFVYSTFAYLGLHAIYVSIRFIRASAFRNLIYMLQSPLNYSVFVVHSMFLNDWLACRFVERFCVAVQRVTD